MKFAEGTSHYTRLNNTIKAMYISKSVIIDEIINLKNIKKYVALYRIMCYHGNVIKRGTSSEGS